MGLLQICLLWYDCNLYRYFSYRNVVTFVHVIIPPGLRATFTAQRVLIMVHSRILHTDVVPLLHLLFILFRMFVNVRRVVLNNLSSFLNSSSCILIKSSSNSFWGVRSILNSKFFFGRFYQQRERQKLQKVNNTLVYCRQANDPSYSRFKILKIPKFLRPIDLWWWPTIFCRTPCIYYYV